MLGRIKKLEVDLKDLAPEMGVFAPPSPFFENVKCVKETEIPAKQQLPKGVLFCDHAGHAINEFS